MNMNAYIEFENVLKKLEDKGYIKVKLIDDYWHYKRIVCERQSIVNKLKEYLRKIDEADYFYYAGNQVIYLFDTRVFVDDFDRIAMKHKTSAYFQWDELEKDGKRNYSFYYPLRETFMRILKPKGYEFEHPHGSAYCRCKNRIRINKQEKMKAKRTQEINDFLETI